MEISIFPRMHLPARFKAYYWCWFVTIQLFACLRLTADFGMAAGVSKECVATFVVIDGEGGYVTSAKLTQTGCFMAGEVGSESLAVSAALAAFPRPLSWSIPNTASSANATCSLPTTRFSSSSTGVCKI